MMNLARTPRDNALRELNNVNLQLMKVISTAQRWHDIRLAADAMFHARLIWDSCYRELFEQKAEGVGGQAPDAPSAAQSESQEKK
jgi:hypothetical protein